MKNAQRFDLCECHKCAERKLQKYLKGSGESDSHHSNSLKLVQVNKGTGNRESWRKPC